MRIAWKGTLAQLMARVALAQSATKLNCALPIDRTDTKSLMSCKMP
jgi:hypothetical protein